MLWGTRGRVLGATKLNPTVKRVTGKGGGYSKGATPIKPIIYGGGLLSGGEGGGMHGDTWRREFPRTGRTKWTEPTNTAVQGEVAPVNLGSIPGGVVLGKNKFIPATKFQSMSLGNLRFPAGFYCSCNQGP